MNYETVLNNCIDRLNAGQPIDDLLYEYPEYADDIQELLDLGIMIPQSRVSQTELNDAMYRITSNIDALIDDEFDDSPIAVLPRRKRRFPIYRLVAGLMMILVGVLAFTFFRSDDENVLNPPPEIIMTDTPTATFTPTHSPTPTETIEPSPTSTPTHIIPTATDTVTPSPTNTFTPTIVPSATPIPPTATPDGCYLPEGWTTYRVRAGDTISGIAVRSNATLDEIYSANCLERGDFIIAGQEFFVPRQPSAPTSVPSAPSTGSQPSAIESGDKPQNPPQQSNSDGSIIPESEEFDDDADGKHDDDDDCDEFEEEEDCEDWDEDDWDDDDCEDWDDCDDDWDDDDEEDEEDEDDEEDEEDDEDDEE